MPEWHTYIDLSSRWPIGPNKPVGRPSATAKRHVLDVQDKQTRVVCLVAGNTNGRTAIWCDIGHISLMQKRNE